MHSLVDSYLPGIDSRLRKRLDQAIKQSGIAINLSSKHKETVFKKKDDILVHTVGLKNDNLPEIAFLCGPGHLQSMFTQGDFSKVIKPLINTLCTGETATHIAKNRFETVQIGNPEQRRLFKKMNFENRAAEEAAKLVYLEELTGYHRTLEYKFILYEPMFWLN